MTYSKTWRCLSDIVSRYEAFAPCVLARRESAETGAPASRDKEARHPGSAAATVKRIVLDSIGSWRAG